MIKAASLLIGLGHPAIPTNIPGVWTVGQLEDNPQTFWADIPPAILGRTETPRIDP